jgi:hypothetical protein
MTKTHPYRLLFNSTKQTEALVAILTPQREAPLYLSRATTPLTPSHHPRTSLCSPYVAVNKSLGFTDMMGLEGNTTTGRKGTCPQYNESLWSSGQCSWLQFQRARVRFPALHDFLRSRGSGTGSTQPREDN